MLKNLLVPLIAVAAIGLTLTAFIPASADKITKAKMKTKEQTAPLVCALDAMTPAERKHYEALKVTLRTSAKEVKELPNGYAFRYEPTAALLLNAAEFISKESLCCSFYTFALEKGGNNGPLWLRITGPKGSKSFIKDALV
jgi:hypothetical protein